MWGKKKLPNLFFPEIWLFWGKKRNIATNYSSLIFIFSFWRNFASKIKTLICTSVFFFFFPPLQFCGDFCIFDRIYTWKNSKLKNKIVLKWRKFSGKEIPWSELYPFSEQFWKGQKTCASLIRFEPTICAEKIGREFEPVS